MTAVLADFQRYTIDVENSSLYKKWLAANPVEAARWTAFANAILRGERPTAPGMGTSFGTSLVDVGVIYLNSLPALTVMVTGTAKQGARLMAMIA